ncbi:MAG: hypothetical protein ACI4QR_01920, partial [Eubacteriales bacterium]
STSFRYPAKDGKPVFTFTVTYRCSRRGKPRIVTYVDGPFESHAENARAREKELRNAAYDTMCKRAYTEENYTFVEYIKNEEGTE